MVFPFYLGGNQTPLVPVTSVQVNNVQNPYVSGGVTLPGAKGDGINNDTAAIKYYLSVGGLVYIPSGLYRVTATLPFARNNTIVFGDGWGASIILVDDSGGNIGDVFTITNLSGWSLSGFMVDTFSGSGRTAGCTVKVLGGNPARQLQSFGICNGGGRIDIDMNNQYDHVTFLDNGGLGDWGTVVGSMDRKAMWLNQAAGGQGIWFNTPHGASQVVNNIFMLTSTLSVNRGPGIRYTASADITLNDVQTIGSGGGFLCDATANPSIAGDALCIINGCQFDSTSTAATYDNVKINVSVGISGIVFFSIPNMWIAGATGNGLHVTGNNTAVNVDWTSGPCYLNGGWGALVDNGLGTAGVNIGTNVRFNGNVSGATHFV